MEVKLQDLDKKVILQPNPGLDVGFLAELQRTVWVGGSNIYKLKQLYTKVSNKYANYR